MYHYIRPTESRFVISKERFRKQMEILRELNYKVISLEHYLDFRKGKVSMPPNAVIVTFDDGDMEIYHSIFPILREFNYPAATFVTPKYIDDQSEGKRGIELLSWDQMREMKKYGCGFYSHSYNSHHQDAVDGYGTQLPVLAHPLYLHAEQRRESDAEYRLRARRDFQKAEKRLRDELGNNRSVFCFPFNAYNDTLLQIGKEEGVELFISGDDGINGRETTMAKRLEVKGEMEHHLFVWMLLNGCTPDVLFE